MMEDYFSLRWKDGLGVAMQERDSYSIFHGQTTYHQKRYAHWKFTDTDEQGSFLYNPHRSVRRVYERRAPDGLDGRFTRCGDAP